MSIHYVVLVGLSLLLVACSTPTFPELGARGQDNTDTGVRYLLGRGVPQDDTKAFYYFNKAAYAGDAFAQNEVAYMYAAGKGVPRDFHKAFVNYEKAAKQGLSSAQYSLALMYHHGLGTAKDAAKAHYWFKRSADLGFKPAIKALEKFGPTT